MSADVNGDQGSASQSGIMKKIRISADAVTRALEFSKEHPLGQELQAIEHTLVLYIKDKFPVSKKVLFDFVFDLRCFSDTTEFERHLYNNKSQGELNETTEAAGFISVNLNNYGLIYTLYYHKGLTVAEAHLFSMALDQAMEKIEKRFNFPKLKPSKESILETMIEDSEAKP